MTQIFRLVLVLLLAVTPAFMMGLGVVHVAHMVKQTQNHATKTEDIKVVPTMYKDYYSKTQVIVTHPVSQILFNEDEVSTTLVVDTADLIKTVEFQTVLNATVSMLTTSLSKTSIMPSPTYSAFEWPLETQIYNEVYNKTYNATVTQVVENALPLI